MKSPAFQFYPTDYLGSQRVRLMTLEEEGVYLNLLCSCWQHGSIPADPELVARLVGKGCSTTVATTVLTMFTPAAEPGRMIHDRLEVERQKQAVWREKSAAGGRKSAEIRKGGSRVVEGPYQPNGNIPSPIPSSSPNIIQGGVADAPLQPSPSKKQKPIFVPPTLAEIQAYAAERRSSVNPQKFFDYFSQGNPPWHDGQGNPVRAWKQKFITWENRGSDSPGLFHAESRPQFPMPKLAN